MRLYKDKSVTEENPTVPTLTMGDKTNAIDSLIDIAKRQITNLPTEDTEIQQESFDTVLSQTKNQNFQLKSVNQNASKAGKVRMITVKVIFHLPG